VWKKKFWRDKTSDAEHKNVLKQLKGGVWKRIECI
jgi:hypothetical protein